MEIHHRKRNRLKNYDYSSPGGYFVTICSAKRKCIFWNEKEWDKTKWNDATLSELGKLIDCEIKRWSETYDNVRIDKYVIMPNHIHIIVIIEPPVEENCVFSSAKPTEQPVGENCVFPSMKPKENYAGEHSSPLRKDTEIRTQPLPTVSRMVKQFKGSVTKQFGEAIWQKSYHDHVIRDEKDYERIWEYIENNPYGCVDTDFDWL